MSHLLTTKQVLDLLKIDRTTIYRMLKDGRLTGVKVGNQWRFHRNTVEEMIQNVSSLQAEVSIEANDVLPVHCIQPMQDVFADIGFFIINPDHISIASMRDINIGSLNIIAIHKPELLDRVFRGETVFVPPITSDVMLDSKGGELSGLPPAMFFAAPVRKADGTIIAAVTKRVDPSKDFSRILQFSRVGETGETYAFDQSGRLLSESRFVDDLRQIGLIKEGASGVLNIEIRDPGGNMVEGYRSEIPRFRQPLTRMADGALQLKSALETKKIPTKQEKKLFLNNN